MEAPKVSDGDNIIPNRRAPSSGYAARGAIGTRTLQPPEAQETVMNDDHPYLEKRMGHKPYGNPRSWGKIAMLLVLIAVACGLILYVAVWANLIQ